MRTSQVGIDLIKYYEGFEPTAYICPAGVWTVGYGHTKNVKPGMTISEALAEELLADDLRDSEAYVSSLITVPLQQYQFDALVSWTFNLGPGNLRTSTLRRKLNAGNYDGAAAEFERWVYSNGKRLAGLVSRREAEARLFRGLT